MVILGEEGEEGLYVVILGEEGHYMVILGVEDGGVRCLKHLPYFNQFDSIVHIDISARCSIFNSRPTDIFVMSEN